MDVRNSEPISTSSGDMDSDNNAQPSTSATTGPLGSFSSKILINRRRQEGNPLLKYIRNVPYEWSADLRADFECAKNCGVLYLSLKYHKLHPGYIETRFADGNSYYIKVLLVLVNVEDPSFVLRDLNMFCYRAGWTLLLSYSVEEAAEYLENLKLSEKRSPETVISNYQNYKQQKQQGNNRPPADKDKNRQSYDQAIKFLCSIRSVSQTDAKRLLGTFGSILSIARASQEHLEFCPGLGPIKAQNVYAFFRAPFMVPS